jgi:hypothetical protein
LRRGRAGKKKKELYDAKRKGESAKNAAKKIRSCPVASWPSPLACFHSIIGRRGKAPAGECESICLGVFRFIISSDVVGCSAARSSARRL